MHTAIEDVHHGGGQHVGIGAANVLVQRQLGRLGSGMGHSQRSAQNGVGAESALVVGAVGLDHHLVHQALILGLDAQQGLGNFAIHMGHRVERALAQIAILVAIAQLNGFESARGSARGHRRAAEGAVLQHNFHFDGGITAGIKNLAPVHIDDDAHECLLEGRLMLSLSVCHHSTRIAEKRAATLPPSKNG